MNDNLNHTQFNIDSSELVRRAKTEATRDGLIEVYEALCEKGYNPIAQLIGYLLTEDPTYITSHKNARKTIVRMDRDEILGMLLRDFLENKNDGV